MSILKKYIYMTKQLSFLDPSADIHYRQPVAVTTWKVFVDGASRNNPGPSGAGACLMKNNMLVMQEGIYLGIKTNNQAEYLAFLFGLFLVEQHMTPHDQVQVIVDSQLLARQITGEYRVKNELLKRLHAVAHIHIARMNVHVSHVLRGENIHADEMANYGIDRKVAPPKLFIDLLNNHGILL